MALTRRLVDLFPQFPPYGGQHGALFPHLTVGPTSDAELAAAAAGLAASLAGSGLTAFCTEFVLIENSAGPWKPMHAFPLGGARRAPESG